MEIYYLVLLIIMIVTLILQIAKSKRIDNDRILYTLKTPKDNVVIAIIYIFLFVVMTLLAVFEFVESKTSKEYFEAVAKSGFWLAFIMLQGFTFVRQYGVTDDGIESITYSNRVIRSYTWEQVPGALRKPKSLKFNVIHKRMNSSIRAQLNEEDVEALNYLKDKIIIDAD